MPEREVLSVEPEDEFLPDIALPTWLRVLSVLAIAGVLVALIAPQLSDKSRHPAAVPQPSRVPTVIRSNTALDVSIGPIGTWVLEGRRLADIGARRETRSVPIPGARFPAGSRPLLAVDVGAHRVWVAVSNAAPARMIEFDVRTLHVIREVTWGQLIQDAVAYGGHLYLSTELGVADLAAGDRQPHLMPGLSGAVGPIALDPVRHRLVTIDLGDPTDIWTFGPGRPTFEGVAPLRLKDGTITVVAGRIWVGGFSDRGAVLERLDPVTLRPLYRAPASEFGPGAIIVDPGARVLWVRPGYGAGPLTCVDATTGHAQQRWDLPSVNAVASDADRALVATSSGPLGLILSGCAG